MAGFARQAPSQSRPPYFWTHSETNVRPCCPHLDPLGRGGPESFARPALTRVPLVATLGLGPGILGEKPQALEGPERFEGPSRSAIRRVHCNPNTGTSSVVERHRASAGICVGESAAKGGSLGQDLSFRLLWVYLASSEVAWLRPRPESIKGDRSRFKSGDVREWRSILIRRAEKLMTCEGPRWGEM
jgi:hypothetical protein